jgi:hypothetical protein
VHIEARDIVALGDGHIEPGTAPGADAQRADSAVEGHARRDDVDSPVLSI